MARLRLTRCIPICLTVLLLTFGSARAETRIGVLVFSDEVQEAADGVLERLREGGYREPATQYLLGNARGNKAKAKALARTFAAARLDLIVTVGTSATVPVARAVKDIPVVFSVVYDPVGANIVESWQNSGNNATGTSAKVPMPTIIRRLNEVVAVKRLAVLYTPGEKNSESQLQDLQKVQGEFRIKVIPVPLTAKGEIAYLLPEVFRTTDALYLTGSNVVYGEIAGIIEMATRARVVTVTHFQRLADRGVLLTVCANTRELGRLAAEKAMLILKGASPSSVPVEALKKFDLIVNMRTARAGKFPIPPSLFGSATRIIQ